MDPFLIPQVIDLAGENPAKTYRQPLAAGDSAAHRWEVRVVRAGAAADLTGCSAAVLARREGEDSSPTVRQRADIAGNVASAEFIPEVYALGGRILAMMVISGSDGRVITAAVLRLQGKTYTTDTICDPEGTIPSLEALLSRYEDMVTATGESRAATQAAQQATEETRAALRGAQTALATAQQAVADAQGALGTAQTAADTANAAAVKIDAMTVSATPLDAGTASAALTLKDGHYHLTLGLPKGDTGATPQISVQVTTGAAGSEASVSVTGTAEEPVIHLTIPRGDTGAIENMTINGKPVESGTITLTPEDLGAATAESVSQLKSDLAAEQTARAEGLAEKLGKTETAADSAKLGGKAPEYYLQPRNLLDNSDFTNPVNQRGQTSYKIVGGYYNIDRWLNCLETPDITSHVIVQDGYITVETGGKLQQKLASYKQNTIYTAAAKRTDGTVLIVSGMFSNAEIGGDIFIKTGSDGMANVGLRSGDYLWIALYEGSYDASTLPAYQPKGYAAELAECQRYYYQSNDNKYGQDGMIIRSAISIEGSTNSFSLESVDLPVTMCITPTITIYDDDGNANVAKEWYTNNKVFNTSIRYANNRSFCVASESGEFVGGKSYFFQYAASADL